jgi:hypothetical protein
MEGVDIENNRMTGVVRDPASLTIVMPQIDRQYPLSFNPPRRTRSFIS